MGKSDRMPMSRAASEQPADAAPSIDETEMDAPAGRNWLRLAVGQEYRERRRDRRG